MNKSQFVDALATHMGGDRKAAAAALDGVIEVVYRAVSTGERVAITGFGVFERRDRRARTARNPQTGAAIKLKKSTVPGFRAGQAFKDVVSGAKKLPKAAKSAPAKSSAAKSTPAKTGPAKAASATKSAAKTAKATGAAKSASPATKGTRAAKSATSTAAKATATTATKAVKAGGAAAGSAAKTAKAAAKPARKSTTKAVAAPAKSGSRKKS